MDGMGSTTHNEPHHSPQTVVDIIAVFGAMFVAAVAIILISVYIGKLRKRQSSQAACDAEGAGDCSTSVGSAPPSPIDPHHPAGFTASPSQLNNTKDMTDDLHGAMMMQDDFGGKPSLWRKTVRSVILRLRGEQQHKDVYVMPEHMRAQLKQMYVY